MTDLQQRYVTQKKLGQGAMGEVWLANDTLLDRPVAMKYLISSQDAPDNETFLSEARILASLNHPNITAIYDALVDEAQGSFCLVMEYVEGKTLSYVIENWFGPMPLNLVLNFSLNILQALQYAHQQGVVHRDIKPDNVLVQKEQVKLTDFGVAGLISLLAQGTEYMAGTPAYMAPEQIQGKAIDGRADLYALGVMMFEMISGGELPYTFSDLDELLDAHLDQSPLPLRNFAPDVPLSLERVVLKLLAKNPDDRYPSAEDVIKTLTSIQNRDKFSQSHLDLLDPNAKPLAGRTEPLQQITATWNNIQQTVQPRLLVIQSDTGMGKTRLITEFLGQYVVDAGYTALVGRCDETGAPYAPYADILATIIEKKLGSSAITPEQTDLLLEQIPRLGRLLNVSTPTPTEKSDDDAPTLPPGSSGLWKILSDRLPDNTPDETDQTEWQFFGTVLTLFNDLGPTAIFLENATILDEASVALTHFLQQQPQLPLLLIAAYRNNAGSSTGTIPWLDSFGKDEYDLIKLTPLDAADIKTCVTNLLGGAAPEAAVELITERSQGNPLQIEEFTFRLLESNQLRQDKKGVWQYKPAQTIGAPDDAFLPRAVMSAFTRQIEKLPKNSRQALALAALLEPGPEFDFNIWAALLDGDDKQTSAQQILEEALKKRVLREVGGQHKRDGQAGRYAFRPSDLAKALASTFSQKRRQELHGKIAKVLHQQQGDPVLMSYHYEKAGATTEAAYQLERAGNKAITANAFDTALVYYQRAGKLVESCSAFKALGYLYRLKGRKTDSVKAFERALSLAQQTGATAEQARILNGLCQTLWLYDEYSPAENYAAAVLKLDGTPDAERITAQTHLGMIAWLTGQLDDAEAWYQKSVAALQKSNNSSGLAQVYQRLGRVYLSQGKLNAAQEIFQQALGLFQELNQAWGQGQVHNQLGRVSVEQGNFVEAESQFASAQALFQKIHSRDGLLVVYANRGRCHLYQNQSDDAMAWLKKALPLALERGKRNVYVLSDIYRLMAEVSLAEENTERAQAAATDAFKLVEAIGNQEYVALATATLAGVYIAQNDPSQADKMYQQALALFKQVGGKAGEIRTRFKYAQFLKQQGQIDKATQMTEKAKSEAQAIGLYFGEEIL